jgi:ectoine hydroxylase-related dioxygenase (phytanoyl-CoA dioxygenase family)
LAQLQAEMEELQRRAGRGELDARHGGDMFLAAFDGDRPPYVHYVNAVTEISPAADAAFHHPAVLEVVERALGPRAYFWDYNGHGAVYQDARPGPGMTYTRIGWHTDHQSRPTSDIWPGLAVTWHLDATSPANGFLRVVPGSHLGGTDGMPLGFEKVPGEVGVYCERGDVMFHHSDLWHSAARATEDPPLGVRRHLRGTFLGGRRLASGEELEPFNKNAAR